MTPNDQPDLLVDCDPGCDDALALALVVKRQLEPDQPYRRVEVLSVAGNVSVEQTTQNAIRALAAYLIDAAWRRQKEPITSGFKVFKGSSLTLAGEEPLPVSVHGRDGLGDAPNRLIWDLPPQNNETAEDREKRETQSELNKNRLAVITKALFNAKSRVSAQERYHRLAGNGTNLQTFDLLCTGPLTNLATALRDMRGSEQTNFWGRCRNAVVMGGAFNLGGNVTHSAEFNTFADPLAAQIVLDSFAAYGTGQEKKRGVNHIRKHWLHFVPLDSTETVALPVDVKTPAKGSAANFVRYALKQYGQFHVMHCKRPLIRDHSNTNILGDFLPREHARAQLGGSNGDGKLKRFCYLHDPLAAWVLLNGKFDENIWSKAEICIDTSEGVGRGRMVPCEPRAKRKSTPIPNISYGLEVKWLNPTKFKMNMKRSFINAVAALVEIPPFWPDEPDDGTR